MSMVQLPFAASEFKIISVLRHFLVFVTLLIFLSLCGCETGIYHTVKPGQTLYRISKTYGIDESYLARVNRVNDPTQLKTGARLYVPGAQRTLYVPVLKSTAVTPAKKIAPIQKKKYVPKPVKVTKKTTVNAPYIPQKSNATNVKKLRWPLRGKIVRSFSSKAKAGGGKGIEIAVRSGSSVVAAEAGKVIYGGDGVNGYGFLIILQHENDLFTVYGFNKKNIVRQGDFVSKGEQIALSGTPPSGGQARLHFEVRKGKQAVNPILYLP
jgi:murein DD-endopeptidase MepM/ murein hydrolase activator NlpD